MNDGNTDRLVTIDKEKLMGSHSQMVSLNLGLFLASFFSDLC